MLGLLKDAIDINMKMMSDLHNIFNERKPPENVPELTATVYEIVKMDDQYTNSIGHVLERVKPLHGSSHHKLAGFPWLCDLLKIPLMLYMAESYNTTYVKQQTRVYQINKLAQLQQQLGEINTVFTKTSATSDQLYPVIANIHNALLLPTPDIDRRDLSYPKWFDRFVKETQQLLEHLHACITALVTTQQQIEAIEQFVNTPLFDPLPHRNDLKVNIHAERDQIDKSSRENSDVQEIIQALPLFKKLKDEHWNFLLKLDRLV